jgi:uncharacterized membrane protein YagU involved in acid resistance
MVSQNFLFTTPETECWLSSFLFRVGFSELFTPQHLWVRRLTYKFISFLDHNWCSLSVLQNYVFFSDKRQKVTIENSAVMGCLAGSGGNFLRTFLDNLSVPS